MRTFVVFVTMLFTISLADANQQTMLRVQLQQLTLESATLTDVEKVDRIQALSTLINLQDEKQTQLVQSPEQLFQSGYGNEAELAFAKWQMLSDLGLPKEQFRLVYVQDKKDLSRQVWLAWYTADKIKLITSSDVFDRTKTVKRIQSEVDVLSVLNPELVLSNRSHTRSSNT